MEQANFIFHGVFCGGGFYGDEQNAPMARILFDIHYRDSFYSHLLADILESANREGPTRLVVCDLPLKCDQFPEAVLQYYDYVMGPLSSTVTHSGPKGPSLLTENVIRAQWEIWLPVCDP